MKLWAGATLLLLTSMVGCGGGGSHHQRVEPLSAPPDKSVALPSLPPVVVTLPDVSLATLAVPSENKPNFPLLPSVSGEPLKLYTTDELTPWIKQSSPTDFTPSKVAAIETLKLETTFSVDESHYLLTNQQLDSNLTVYANDTVVNPAAVIPLYYDVLNAAYLSNYDEGELIIVGELFPYRCPKGAICKPQPAPFFNPILALGGIALKSPNLNYRRGLYYDGRFLMSAKSGDKLVIVSVYEPEVKTSFGWKDGNAEARQKLLANVSAWEYMASSYEPERSRISDACYTSGDMADFKLGSAINMTTIDLRTHSIVGNTCLLSDITSLAVSDTSIALQLPNGSIHDFAINAGEVTYVGVR